MGRRSGRTVSHLVWMVAALGAWLGFASAAGARECPRGRVFDPTFAACVQADCNDVPLGHYAYGGECVCSTAGSIAEKATDPTKRCSRSSTDPSCPSCLYKCIRRDQSCPAAEPAPSPMQVCEESCTEYHSRGVEAKLFSGECRCVCKEGWKPDKTLTCKEVECDELCRARLGEHGVSGASPHPDCGCTCENGYAEKGGTCERGATTKKTTPTPSPTLTCPPNAEPDSQNETCWCRSPFKPEPVDGTCVVDPRANCGDKFCDNRGAKKVLGEIRLFEDCELCPEDCGCATGEFCSPKVGKEAVPRCRPQTATLEDWGCKGGVVKISVWRQRGKVTATRGMALTPGDEVNFDLLSCEGGFANFTWGSARGRVLYPKSSPDLFHRVTIGEDAITSGWPRTGNESAEVAWKLVRDEGIGRLLPTLLGPLATVVGFGMGADSSGGAATFVWLKSELIIVQRSDETARVITLSGSPELQIGDGPRLLVPPGQAVDIDAAGLGVPAAFITEELDALQTRGFSWCAQGRELDGAKCIEPVRGSGRVAGLFSKLGIGLIVLSCLGLAFAAARRSRG